MKANAKYTAKEILDAAGVPTPEFGKVAIRIAGLRGITTPDHLIKLGQGISKVEILVGVESYELDLDGDADEMEFSDDAKKALKVKGEKSNAASEKRMAEKLEAKEKAEK